MSSITVWETFESIQGESSYAGLACFFIRLAGCNLRCAYCDTPQAYSGGSVVDVEELVDAGRGSRSAIVEITGGEPLLQPAFADLAAALRDRSGKTVLVETNGSRDISVIPPGVVAIMDLKCPGSGQHQAMDYGNIRRLRPYDEVKFVIGSREDFEWACRLTGEHDLRTRCHAIFFSAVFGQLDPKQLGGWILESGLGVRLQVQLHKLIGMK